MIPERLSELHDVPACLEEIERLHAEVTRFTALWELEAGRANKAEVESFHRGMKIERMRPVVEAALCFCPVNSHGGPMKQEFDALIAAVRAYQEGKA